MTPEPCQQEMRTLWRSQQMEFHPLSLEEIRRQARRFQNQIRWRNLREYLAAVVVSVLFVYTYWFRGDTLLRLGTALTIAGALYVCYQIHKRGSARKLPAEPALKTCIEFHRTELVRQRDLLRDVWRWYLLPFVPGFSLMVLAKAVPFSSSLWASALLLLVVVIWAATFWFIAALNSRAARRLQQEIDALDKNS